MKFKVLILATLLMLTSTQTFAATFADISNVDAPQFVTMDNEEEDVEDVEDVEEEDIEDVKD